MTLLNATSDWWMNIVPLRRANCVNHLGTLGTNHHRALLDEANKVWVMLHKGSRGIGNRIGNYFIEKAKNDMKRLNTRL